jgi:hypothetical protein
MRPAILIKYVIIILNCIKIGSIKILGIKNINFCTLENAENTKKNGNLRNYNIKLY